MPFSKLILTYLAMTAAFFAVDLVWLGLIAKDFYNKQIGHLMATNVNWVAAIIFYLLFIVGILIFAVLPAHEKVSFSKAAIYGALFGFFTYATYDLTNLATLKDWPIGMTIIDMIWGAVLTATVASVGYWVLQKIA